MERENHIQEDAHVKATKKVTLVKGFYRHLTLFLIFIVFLLVDVVVRNTKGTSLFGPIDFIPTYFYWGPWAMSIIIHGIIVFDVISFFKGKDWEDKQLQKYIDEDHKKSTIHLE